MSGEKVLTKQKRFSIDGAGGRVMRKAFARIAICPSCHRTVRMRKDGSFGQHRVPNSKGICLISGSTR